jgi:hypothetical protein
VPRAVFRNALLAGFASASFRQIMSVRVFANRGGTAGSSARLFTFVYKLPVASVSAAT